MNIAYDMYFSMTAAMQRGIGRYSKNLLQNIVRQDKENSFYYFYPDLDRGSADLGEQLHQFLTHNEIDLFHFLGPFQYSVNSILLKKEWFGKTKVAVTLYDIIPWLFKDQYFNDGYDFTLYLQTLEFVKSCDIVYSISETTKNDAIAYLGMDPNKIKVIMAGVEEQFKVIPDVDRSGLAARYGITRPYIMCTGGLDFRKNTNFMLQSFGGVKAHLGNAYQLVLCCDVPEPFKQSITNMAKSAGVLEDLVFTGYVSDAELVQLYNGAVLFAFPSLYEGLGLPVLEAMACGTPVLTSNNSSLGEISGDAAYTVNPAYPEQIAAGMIAMLTQPHLLAKYKNRGLHQAGKFKWGDVARKVLDSYSTICRKKIAIFSPLPPLRSSIVDYVQSVFPELSKYYDIDLFIDDGYEHELQLTDLNGSQVFSHHLFESLEKHYDAVMYQLGDHQHHHYMIPYLRKFSGIIVLHDLNLHKMTADLILSNNDLEQYYHILYDDFGNRTHEIVNDILSGKIVNPDNEVLVNQYYLKGAKSVIVHNQLAERAITNKVSNVKMLRPPKKITNEPSLRRKHKLIFSSFGDRQESANVILKSVRELVDQGNHNLEYRIVGKFDQAYLDSLQAQINSLELETYVTFYDSPSEEEYSNADIAILMESSSSGESADLLHDVLTYGVPAIIPEVEGYREIPNEVVYKIVNNPAEDHLVHAMQKLYQDRDLRNSLSQRARDYINQTYSVATYVELLRDVIESVSKRNIKTFSNVLWQKPIHAISMGKGNANKAHGFKQVIRLKPNRYKKTNKGRKMTTYLSFNLTGLPSGSQIKHAKMHIPVKRPVTKIRVHRIKKTWTEKSLISRKPQIHRKPVFSKSRKKQGIIKWDCTSLARRWAQGKRKNHGIYVPFRTKPVLYVKVITSG